jgi:hypothetical protein
MCKQYREKSMVRRLFCPLLFWLTLLAAIIGCDNRPKVVMPAHEVPPPPKPVVAGGGSAHPAPEMESREKLGNPKQLPGNSTSNGDKE